MRCMEGILLILFLFGVCPSLQSEVINLEKMIKVVEFQTLANRYDIEGKYLKGKRCLAKAKSLIPEIFILNKKYVNPPGVPFQRVFSNYFILSSLYDKYSYQNSTIGFCIIKTDKKLLEKFEELHTDSCIDCRNRFNATIQIVNDSPSPCGTMYRTTSIGSVVFCRLLKITPVNDGNGTKSSSDVDVNRIIDDLKAGKDVPRESIIKALVKQRGY